MTVATVRRPRSQRLSGWALRVLYAGVVFAVIAGVTSAILGHVGLPARGDLRCDQPPCFDFSIPSGTTPVMMAVAVFVPLTMLAFVLALLLGIPGLLMGLFGLVRGRGSAAAFGPLVFAGTLVVVVGYETLPHLLCAPFQGGWCDGRWHELAPALTGSLPLAIGLWWLLRRRASRSVPG